VWRPAPPGAPPPGRGFGEAPPAPGGEPDGDPGAPGWKVAGALKGHRDDVMDVAWAPDGSALLSGCVENELVVFDVDARRSVVGWGLGLDGRVGAFLQGVSGGLLGGPFLQTRARRAAAGRAAHRAGGAPRGAPCWRAGPAAAPPTRPARPSPTVEPLPFPHRRRGSAGTATTCKAWRGTP
jgi:hypothetical protein